MEKVVGIVPVSATVSAKSNVVLSGENAVVNVNFTGTPPWNLSYKVNGQTTVMSNISSNPLTLTFPVTSGQSIVVEPVSVSNASVAEGTVGGTASVSVADKTINPFFDAYVHQTNKTISYTTDQFVQVKTSTDNYSREAYFSFNLDNVKTTDEKITFRAYFYQRVYPNNENILENHVVEIDGNTDSYGNTLTWNTKPTNMSKIGETLVYPSDMGNYISWDITNWVKEQVAAGKSKATLSLKVANGGAGLLYFYSSESPTNKPQLIIDSSETTTGTASNRTTGIRVWQVENKLIVTCETDIQSVSVISSIGKCVYQQNKTAATSLSIDTSNFPTGVYLVNVGSKDRSFTQKFIKQ
jgi:hypothetical protein